MHFLRQSTVATIKMGPFVSPTDGLTPYTTAGFTVKLASSGGSLAARHDATTIVHDADGNFAVELDATDTATVGRLRVSVPGSAGNYLPVWQEYTVLSAAVYDSLMGNVALSTFSGGAVASVTAPVTVGTVTDKTGYSLTTAPPTITQIVNGVWDEPKAGHTTAGSFGLFLDATVSSRLATAGYTAPTDPWATAIPGAYGAGTAGNIVGTNLNATILSRSTYAGGDTSGTTTLLGLLTPTRATKLDNLDVAISTRSTYAGGAVASVTAPVTVGTNSDKTGYSLAVAPPTLTQIVGGVWDEPKSGHVTSGTFGVFLDAAISSRSTFAGGAVASVTAPVTVGTNSDKTGYSLAVAPPTAAQNAAAVWTDATAGDFAAAGSPGLFLMAQLAGTLVGTTSVFTAPALANAPTGGGGGGASASAIAAAVWQDLLASADFATTGSVGALLLSTLDAPMSSRSTYAGGPVSGVTGPVTVGTNNDKDGYGLATPPPTVAQVVAGVWDEPQAGHTTAGSFGLFLDAATSTRMDLASYVEPPTAAENASAIWTDATPSDFAIDGSPGKLLMGQLAGSFVGTTSAFSVPALANSPAGAGGATSTWQDPVASDDFTVTGSIGATIVAALAKLDATISSRMAAADYVAPTDPWTIPIVGTPYVLGTAGGILGALSPSVGGGTNILQQPLTGDTTVAQALVSVFSYCCGPSSNPTANAVNNTWIDWQRRNPVTDEIAYIETIDEINKIRTGFTPVNLG